MSGSLTLVVDRRAAALRLEGGALRVDLVEGGFHRAPLAILERVVVHGAVPVSCDVWRALAGRGIGAVLLPSRGRGASAFVGAGLAPFVRWRTRQYAAFFDDALRLEMARSVLTLKLSAYRRRAVRLPSGAMTAKAALQRALENAASAPNLDSLRGVEGAVAALWFSALGDCVAPAWGFVGRSRRPPRDPVNALLSLGYTLALGAVRVEVLAQGLDPALGFLHAPAPARESLALDALEPLRAGVDGVVLDVLASLEPRDFSCTQAEGCRLRKEARKLFYAAWSQGCAEGFGCLFEANFEAEVRQVTQTDPSAPASLASACRAAVNALRKALPRVKAEVVAWGG